MAAVYCFAADYVFAPLPAGISGPNGDFGGLAGEIFEENYNDYNFYNDHNLYILLSDQYGHGPAHELVEILVSFTQLALS